MINYKILNPKFFKKYAEYVESLIDEGLIKFGNGIEMIGIDPSRICIFKLCLGSDAVEIIEDEETQVVVKMCDLVKVLARFSNPEYLNFHYDNKNAVIKIKGKIKNKKKTFTLKEMDSDINAIPFDDLLKISYTAIFKMKGSDLEEIVKDAEIYSEILTISTKDFGLKFRSEGIHGYTETDMEPEREIYAEEIASYSNTFLKNIVKAIKNSEIWVMFKTDYPICIYDKVSEETYVRIFLAPRVNE